MFSILPLESLSWSSRFLNGFAEKLLLRVISSNAVTGWCLNAFVTPQRNFSQVEDWRTLSGPFLALLLLICCCVLGSLSCWWPSFGFRWLTDRLAAEPKLLWYAWFAGWLQSAQVLWLQNKLLHHHALQLGVVCADGHGNFLFTINVYIFSFCHSSIASSTEADFFLSLKEFLFLLPPRLS